MSGLILHLAISQSLVFLVNSRLGHFSVADSRQRPFSRSYRTILPSSLAMNLSSTCGFSPRPPVSVYGTGTIYSSDRGFSRKSGYPRCWLIRGLAILSRSTSRTHFTARDISTRFNGLFRQSAEVSLLLPPFSVYAGAGILTGCPSCLPLRVTLRPRLTLIRLTLIRNPWSSGEEVFDPLSRYLCLHLLFHTLQHASQHTFYALWNAPLPSEHTLRSKASVFIFMPDYHPRTTPRLVSCYALFK